ncbi:uncharacterized protein [Mytilus edulis]|uniref:uncharacterized protein isoform X1 n=1 Tax=Mytilus edulis TaxID=6550 RepID=UPI0039F08D2A
MYIHVYEGKWNGHWRDKVGSTVSSLCIYIYIPYIKTLTCYTMEGFTQNYIYIGCFEDRSKRLLPVGPFKTRNYEMSAKICFHHCKSTNLEYFATEYGNECFCGHGIKIGSKQYKRKAEKYCNKKCKGHVTMKCGGRWRASVYKINRDDHQSTTSIHTPTTPKRDEFVKDAVPIIVVSALAFLLIAAAVLVTIVVCYRGKKSRNSQPIEIQQNVIIAENNDSSVYTEVMSNDIGVSIIKIKEDKDVIKTSHCKTQGVAASIEQDTKYESLSTDRNSIEHIYESDVIHKNQYKSLTHQQELDIHTYASAEHAISQDIKTPIDQKDEVCNKYESLSTNRNTVEHTYESDSINNNRYESLKKPWGLDKHTYAYTEHVMSQNNKTSIYQEDKDCNKYESLSTNRNSADHTYESDSIHTNQYESLTHKQELEDYTYDSLELALHTSTESDVNQYQSLTMPAESDTHLYASNCSIQSRVINAK